MGPRKFPFDPFQEQAYRDCAERIIKSGASPVFVLAPMNARFAVEFQDPKPAGIVLNFSDYVNYPTLYQVNLRYDTTHLNRTGADEFTKILADKFVRFLHPEQKP